MSALSGIDAAAAQTDRAERTKTRTFFNLGKWQRRGAQTLLYNLNVRGCDVVGGNWAGKQIFWGVARLIHCARRVAQHRATKFHCAQQIDFGAMNGALGKLRKE